MVEKNVLLKLKPYTVSLKYIRSLLLLFITFQDITSKTTGCRNI